ncbi:fumarylacetoacetate hydrolase family protein [Nesterenkonia aerolata]|uniref:Fumarylacetoacetate hydrolase family protein n=1 Tax=Nesterenkonia aerolata TaxID=3074079 RepID=A0ABU2DPT0_9MICC|nr:fumarylacetoacetate hydrolase family protein [Nesterenkonia sp. LY-0111]MDR8018522.1 fumarylacetoacetate hydrolase family protein [Nesterenkonia sp. LY-0111]
MRIARFVTEEEPVYGVVTGEPGEEIITELTGDPFFVGVQQTSTTHALADVRLVAPIIPRSKAVGIGRNYADHAAEMGNELPASPMMFFIPNTAIAGPGDPITLPSFSEEVHYEAELCVVIGRICKDVPLDRVSEVIFGYTVGNDVSARDAQRTDGQWARAKGFDGSAPIGPWIETELDPEGLRISGRLNGETVQDSSTSEMVFGVPELVSYASQAFTLLPGDVIFTGTPAGVGPVTEGDRFEAEIEGIGTLTNTFRR